MENKKTGGSAFPEPYLNSKDLALSIEKGMTLRDYFAAKAMEKISYTLYPSSFWDAIKLFSRNLGFKNEVNFEKNYNLKNEIPMCYTIADAMIAERDK